MSSTADVSLLRNYVLTRYSLIIITSREAKITLLKLPYFLHVLFKKNIGLDGLQHSIGYMGDGFYRSKRPNQQ